MPMKEDFRKNPRVLRRPVPAVLTQQLLAFQPETDRGNLRHWILNSIVPGDGKMLAVFILGRSWR